jgi:hypothetical protein
MIYTIQDENGERGWIQKIDNGIEIDEIQGGSGEIDPQFNHHHIVISKEEYYAIKWLLEMSHASQEDISFHALNLLIEATIEKNRDNRLVGVK